MRRVEFLVAACVAVATCVTPLFLSLISHFLCSTTTSILNDTIHPFCSAMESPVMYLRPMLPPFDAADSKG